MDLHARQRVIRWGDRPLIMGIVNVTPDSFFDGGAFCEPEAAVEHALRLVDEGADILDIGAESTRPGATPIDSVEEYKRLIPVVTAVAKSVSAPISVDTSKATVAKAAIDAGAVIVNDITALQGDGAMRDLIAETKTGLVLMHMQGIPQTMQRAPRYENVVTEVNTFLSDRVRFAIEGGIAENQIILDPGIGFGKVLEHNLDLLARLEMFTRLGYPLLVGLSRKAFIGHLTNQPVEARLMGTAAAVSLAVQKGAHILRVHDVAAMRDVIKVVTAIKQRQAVPLKEQHA